MYDEENKAGIIPAIIAYVNLVATTSPAKRKTKHQRDVKSFKADSPMSAEQKAFLVRVFYNSIHPFRTKCLENQSEPVQLVTW